MKEQETVQNSEAKKPVYDPPKVLITGASSGIGRACAELFAKGGYAVYGVSRSMKRSVRRYRSGGSIHFLPMDVTDEDSVRNTIRKIGPVDTAILSAGFGIAGSCEEVSVGLAKRQMEVNYFGVLRVVSEILPPMRKRMYGRIILIGSLGGRVAVPMQSHYSSSKSALAAYSDALRMELAPYDIDVTLVEPGDTRTGFTDKREVYIPEDSPYKEQTAHAIGVMEKDEREGLSAESVAKTILRCARSDHPPARVIPGIKGKCLGVLIRVLPDRTREYIVKKKYLQS